MAEVKISELTSATTPLAGTETVPIVQGGVTKKVAVSNLGGGSGVTDVTATSPIVSTGGATPDISISQSGAATDGYLSTGDWNAFNSKQATLVSGTNIKTINGSSVLGSGDLVINAGNRLATHILAKPRSGFNYSISLTQGNLTTGSQTANTLVLTAFTPAYNFEIDRFILYVSTLAAGGLAKVVVYSDLDGVPYSKLYESATVTTDTTGLKTMSGFTYLFSAGVTYWIGVVTNTSVAQFTVLNSASLMLAPVIASTTSTQIFTCWSIPVTFASLPATLTTPTTGNLSHLSVPYIMFRAY